MQLTALRTRVVRLRTIGCSRAGSGAGPLLSSPNYPPIVDNCHWADKNNWATLENSNVQVAARQDLQALSLARAIPIPTGKKSSEHVDQCACCVSQKRR
ncbi:hypothetical protein AG1IA_07671 [Rhizoctonia solani AG-1 IA]|uniref:Uncharacterized protein n=1 Tax=Thanatephorus cucumeris (strain AG1-IA) TaxID=983506 RepID=L8WK78_THACA|nr:hypothetical protein AG1IA_07671 [Rhizoctonia solani AG-1 IA]